MVAIVRFVFVAVGLLAWMNPARGEGATLESYHHSAFAKAEGWPGAGPIAQTADGFLWITGTRGLTRYDGRHFSAFVPAPGEKLPDVELGMLHPAEGGGLWIASDQGATLLQNGHLTHFTEPQGYAGVQGHFVTGPEGHVWSYTARALMRFAQGRWQVMFRSAPDQTLGSAAFDEDGNLWAVLGRRLHVMPRGQARFAPVPGMDVQARRVFAADGHLCVTTADSVRILRRDGTALTELAKPLPARVFAMQRGRDGSLWFGSSTQGLYYLAPGALAAAEAGRTVPAFRGIDQAHGLTGDYAPYLWLDHEGDLWVNTTGGLDRFRRAAFTRVDLPAGVHTVSALADGHGNLWAGFENKPVHLYPPAGEPTPTELPPLTLAFYADPRSGDAWAANAQGVWRLSPGKPRLERPFTRQDIGLVGALPCMLRNDDGSFYVCVPYSGAGNGLLVSDGDGWKNVFDHPVFPVALARDGHGGIWVGSRDPDVLYRLSQGRQIAYGAAQGLAIGVVRSIETRDGQLWIGGDRGIQYADGQRFATLVTDRPDIDHPVAGLAIDDQGDLWAQTLDGVLRFRATDIARYRRGELRALHAELFDDRDNVIGVPNITWSNPNLKRGADGRIWVQTTTALAWADPRQIPQEHVRPVVYIDALETSRRAVASPQAGLRLSPGEKAIRIAFTAPALGRPDRLAFRYRLLGMSDAWTDAGDRTEATYTNLAPGRYRFEVVATNGTASSERAATLDFERLPAYYETWWFRALWAVPVALILWLIHDARSRALARRLKIRSDEREAVARDIHDTLLQRLHAVMMSLQRLSSDASIPPTARTELARVRDDTREAIVEGREQIGALRRSQDSGLALYDELMAEGRRLQQQSGIHFALQVHGSPRALKSLPASELRDAALEAMRNAFTHSGASAVRITLAYEDAAFWIVVADDGHGFDEAQATRARRDGHFGLLGMRERITRLKGAMQIESSAEEGTEIHLRVPARSIYARGKDTLDRLDSAEADT